MLANRAIAECDSATNLEIKKYTYLLNYLVICYMEQSPFLEASQFSASQEIPRILCNPNVHYHSYKCPPTVPILSQLDPVYDKWLLVTTAWRVLRFRMEERPSILRVVANILNKHWRTADKGWSYSLGGWARCYLLLIGNKYFVTKCSHRVK